MNGSGVNENSLYAFWAGAEDPNRAPFWVKKNGEMKASNGTFTGVLRAAKVSGVLSPSDDPNAESPWLLGCGISVGGDYKRQDASGKYTYGNFCVDGDGNVIMNGNLTLKDGVITWSSLESAVTDKIDTAQSTASDASQAAANAKRAAANIANGVTSISDTTLYSPTIYAGTFYAVDGSNNFAKMDADSFILYQNGSEKISLQYGSDRNEHTAALSLGYSKGTPGMIKKKGQGSSHTLWLGNDGETCGILISLSGSGEITLKQGGKTITFTQLLNAISN